MKKEQLRLPDYLNHITQAIERINVYIKDIGKEGWVASTLIQDAVIRNIEIIGEASHNVQTLHQEFAKENADFPWDDAYWMRNVLSHGYFQVDLDIVWETITSDLPVFLEKIRSMPSRVLADDDLLRHP